MVQVVVCNTVPVPPSKASEKIEVLSIAEFLAHAIARIHMKQSVSELFSSELAEDGTQPAETAHAANN